VKKIKVKHILLIFILAYIVRMYPLHLSPLPYNIDGYPLVRLAEDISHQGVWKIRDVGHILLIYNSKLPIFIITLSMFSQVVGKIPLYTIQYLMPAFGATTTVLIYMLVYRVTSRNSIALCSAFIMLFLGPFVYFTMASMKQTMAFALYPLAMYLFLKRSDMRMRVLLVIISAMMPFLHHLTSLMLYLAMLYAIVMDYFNAPSIKNLLLDTISGPFWAIPGYIYYKVVDLQLLGYFKGYEEAGATLAAQSQGTEMLTFASVIFLFLIFALKIRKPRERQAGVHSMLAPVLITLLGLAVIIGNTIRPIFYGVRTTTTFLLFITPYLIIILIAIYGYSLVKIAEFDARSTVYGILLAPFTLISHALLRDVSPMTMDIVYRAYDFLDPGIAVLVAIGIYFLSIKKKISYLLPITVILSAMTLPYAYAPADVYEIESVTYEHEFYAMQFLAEKSQQNITLYTDQRVADIFSPYFEHEADMHIPYAIIEDEKFKGYALLDSRWCTRGAQQYPVPNIVINSTLFYDYMGKECLILQVSSVTTVYVLYASD